MAPQIEHQERRMAARLAIRDPLRFRTRAGTIHAGTAVNISRTGAFILTEDLPPLGARIELEMTPGDGFRVAVAVVRAFVVPFHETTLTRATGIGVRFL